MEPTNIAEQGNNFQEIHCIGKDSIFSFPVFENEVVVNASKIDSTEANTASNKVKVSQIAKVDWEERFYHGNLVSCNSTFVAYIIKSKGDKEDHVRVINYQTSSRLLLRGPKKKVVDICFESFNSNQLACVDSEGTVHVFKIVEKDGIIKSNLIIKIFRENVTEKEKQRLTWAPNLLLPMDTHESMIAVSNGNNAEVYDLKKILETFKLDEQNEKEDPSSIGTLDREFNREDIMVGVKLLKDCHTKTITCLALSPDTNVLVTCSEDGDVKFWTIKFSDPTSCLHEWEPHDGEPVTSLFFCDNLLVSDDTNPFWRYLMTGTNMSSVLKIWCAVKWECLQTIEFAPYTDQIPTCSPCMKLALDISAKFLIMADIHRPVLYICHLSQDIEKEKISIVSVSEFILKEPLLSFSIFVAKDRKGQYKTDEGHNDMMINGVDVDGDDSIDIENGTDKNILTSVTLFAIQKRAIQKLSIKFSANTSKDSSSPSISTAASSQEDLTSIRDALSDIDFAEIYGEKMQIQESTDISIMSQLNESIGSSITAVSNTTVNGNHVESECQNDLIETTISFNSLRSSVTDSFADTILTIKEKCDTDLEVSIDPILNGLTSSVESNIPGVSLESNRKLSLEHEQCIPLSGNFSIEHEQRIPCSGNFSIEHEQLIPCSGNFSIEHEQSIPRSGNFLVDLEQSIPRSGNFSVEHEQVLPRSASAPCHERKSISKNSSDQASTKVPDIPNMETPTTDQLIAQLNNQQKVLNEQQQLLFNQQQELRDIKDMLKQLLNKQNETVTYSSEFAEKEHEDLKVYMQLLQKSTTTQLSKANKEFNKLCTQKLDQFLTSLNSLVQQKEEQNLASLQNIVSNTISIKLEKTIKQEMKQTVTTSLEKLHTKYMDNISNQIGQKLSIWERSLREEIKELMKNPALADAIGGSAANILQGTIPDAYTECFTRIILPGFEKALLSIFNQVDKTFRQGTREYLENVSKQLEAKRQKQQDSQDPLLVHLQELIQSFQATADRLTSGVETNLEALMQKQLRDSLDKMQNNFSKTVESRIAPSLSESVSISVTNALEEFKRKINESLAESLYQQSTYQHVSPEQAIKDRKTRINALVQEGNYNKAFEEALTASDLALVMYLCTQVEPNGLFQDADNSFPQPIILSLIQQLSVNLGEETETKRRYLEESIMALDKDDEITREHLPAVLVALNGQLSITIDTLLRTDSTNIQLKPLKMLLMASKSLLHGA